MDNRITAVKQAAASLNELYREWHNADNGRDEISQQIETEVRKVQEQAVCELAELEKQEKRIRPFLQIAMGNGCKKTEAAQPLPLDAAKLSRLALMGRSAADQLYTETSGQLLELRHQRTAIEQNADRKASQIRARISGFNSNTLSHRQKLVGEMEQYLAGDEMNTMVRFLQDASEETPVDSYWNLGQTVESLRLPPSLVKKYADALGGEVYNDICTLKVPCTVDPNGGETIWIDYAGSAESHVLNGIQSLIYQTLRDFAADFDSIYFIDPIRYNASALGTLAPLASETDSFIRRVPASSEETAAVIGKLVSELSVQDPAEKKCRLLVFHAFPDNYDSNSLTHIRQLCANAANYGITLVLTCCKAETGFEAEGVQYIRQRARHITWDGSNFESDALTCSGKARFVFNLGPKSIPQKLLDLYNSRRELINRSNAFHERVGYALPTYRKGVRRLTNIPYGVNEKTGKLLTLDFENSNFATFICGASRSGKSTLLHTILSGIFKNNHPDDVEVWLIDFKMTEFSRYIEHTPPHVRYILLDESKELVYDIIDRLTEILRKRQNLFKGKWQKLSDVPPEKYMPAMFIVIDEFSVMSEVLADSIMNATENYSLKLQALLAKGAALGMHFIFASQGFTSGTRGLNDFSKKQIQQRIAMKTEFAEIRETLDLKSTSDEDQAIMEQLPVHYALARIPVDARGNHLVMSHVLYITDNSQQEQMIDEINALMHPVPVYDANDPSTYIDKKTLVVDGNSFTSYSSKRPKMRLAIEDDEEAVCGDKLLLYPGEPRRMLPLYPIELMSGYCENLLLMGSLKEKDTMLSALLSIAASGRMQQAKAHLWTTETNPLYKKYTDACDAVFARETVGLEEVCGQIRQLKSNIQQGLSPAGGRQITVLLGLERLMLDMAYWDGDTMPAAGYGELGEDELDINQLLDRAEAGEKLPLPQENADEENTDGAEEVPAIYDARDDISYIITQGPRLGYHFIGVFNTCLEFDRTGLDSDLFRHKLMLRMPSMDVSQIVNPHHSGSVSQLEDHIMLYTNGLDCITFRPYLHNGLCFDGWRLNEAGRAECLVDDTENYLL